ncbi:MAG: Lpg1974 family pore-forming outer membrane protein, partial [Rhabdochlamydiaceae bacterium]
PQLRALENAKPQLTSSPNWSISADFLAWYASEEVASIWADVITIGVNTSTWRAPAFNFKWDYGLRLGIGHALIYDQWDTAFYWTWFRTDAKHTIPSQADTRIGPEFDAAFLSFDVPQSMSAHWSLDFNMFDWELGRSFRISKNLSFRPFVGLKGGWINQSIHARYFDLTINSVLTNKSGKEHLRNNFWGIGPLGGVNTKWSVRNFGSHSFNFFGDFSMAAMWGTWSCGDIYKNTIPKKYSVNTQNSSLGALMLRGFVGVGWDVDFHAGGSHFATKLGYEMQLWLDQLRIATFQLQRLHDDLTLQGVTFNCRFDF